MTTTEINYLTKSLAASVQASKNNHRAEVIIAKRGDLSMSGLVREAALRALEDAGMTFEDIDAVVMGKAPDFFEGLMMPELYLAEALGAVGKPLLRVHTAGSVGGRLPRLPRLADSWSFAANSH